MNTQEIAKAYDAVADSYAEVRSQTIGVSYVDRLCKRLPAAGLVLDLGCGTGLPLSRRLVERGFQIHGLDASPRMIEHARYNVPQGTFEIGDIASWTPTRTFDGILAWDSLFHLEPPNHVPVLRTLHADLRSGGVILFTAGGREGEIRSSMLGREFYYSSLSTKDYSDVLLRIGFTVLSLEKDPPGEEHIVVIAVKGKANQKVASIN